jgi:hypothetical protein
MPTILSRPLHRSGRLTAFSYQRSALMAFSFDRPQSGLVALSAEADSLKADS